MKYIFCFLVIFGFCLQSVAQDPIDKAKNQLDEIKQLLAKKEPSLSWNRYVSKNFEVLSLDDPQGKYLYDNVEFIKTWITWRWGLQDVDFPTPCKIMCVPNADLYGKLFNGKSQAWKADKSGYNVWFITEGQQWNTKLPSLLTEIVLYNFELKYNSKLPAWCHRGMSVLNGRLDDIYALTSNVKSLDVNSLLTTSQESYNTMSEADKTAFDARATVFALCLKKNFGNKGFLKVLEASLINPGQCLQVIKLSSGDADAKFPSYFYSLLADKRNLSW